MEERKRLKRLQHRAVRRELDARAAAAEQADKAEREAKAAAEAVGAGAAGGDVPPPPQLVKNVSYFLGPGASKRVLVRLWARIGAGSGPATRVPGCVPIVMWLAH